MIIFWVILNWATVNFIIILMHFSDRCQNPQIENVLRAIFYYFNIYYLWLKNSVIIDQFNTILCIQFSFLVSMND